MATAKTMAGKLACAALRHASPARHVGATDRALVPRPRLPKAREEGNAQKGRKSLQLRPTVCSATTNRKSDYGANATDMQVLHKPPFVELYEEEIANCFCYPRNLEAKYELKERIGSGNFGVVYLVKDRKTGIKYACKSIPKIPRKKETTTSHTLLKIRAEIDSMQRLGPSLDAVFLKDVFEDSKHVHLVMELCEGGPVMGAKDAICMSEQFVAGVARTVLRFLAQCHSKDLVYRDVKPENFLYTTTGSGRVLKATDFGLSISWNKKKDPPINTPAGTPIYMAPEMVNKSYGSKADQYCAGVMFFQMLTGRYPYWPSMKFKGPTMAQLFTIIKEQQIDFSAEDLRALSPEAQDFLQKLLIRDPQERPSATEALAHPWLREEFGERPASSLNGTVVQRLQKFAINSRLKQLVLTMIAQDMFMDNTVLNKTTSFDLSNLQMLWDIVDRDESGDASTEELIDALVGQGYSISEDEVRQLMSRMDIRGTGYVGFDEFATSLLDWHAVQDTEHWRELCYNAFQRLDANGDGSLSVEEIATMLCPDVGEEEVLLQAKKMMRDFDANGDGEISWEEFYYMLSRDNLPQTLEFFDARLTKDSFDEDVMTSSRKKSADEDYGDWGRSRRTGDW